jgi:hypothetical protein
VNENDFFEKKHLAKEDLANGPIVATISHVRAEMLRNQRTGDEEKKPLLCFSGNIKPIVCNKVNFKMLQQIYGREVEGWYGKPIELYVKPDVEMNGQMVGGIRLRMPSRPAHSNGQAPQSNYATFQDAVAAVQRVGLSRDHVIQVLKSKGFSGYMSLRDSPTVDAMIKEQTENLKQEQPAPPEESFDPSPADLEIPF